MRPLRAGCFQYNTATRLGPRFAPAPQQGGGRFEQEDSEQDIEPGGNLDSAADGGQPSRGKGHRFQSNNSNTCGQPGKRKDAPPGPVLGPEPRQSTSGKSGGHGRLGRPAQGRFEAGFQTRLAFGQVGRHVWGGAGAIQVSLQIEPRPAANQVIILHGEICSIIITFSFCRAR